MQKDFTVAVTNKIMVTAAVFLFSFGVTNCCSFSWLLLWDLSYHIVMLMSGASCCQTNCRGCVAGSDPAVDFPSIFILITDPIYYLLHILIWLVPFIVCVCLLQAVGRMNHGASCCYLSYATLSRARLILIKTWLAQELYLMLAELVIVCWLQARCLSFVFNFFFFALLHRRSHIGLV